MCPVGGCAYGVVDEPGGGGSGDEVDVAFFDFLDNPLDDGTDGAGSSSGLGSEGACYAGAGACNPMGADCGAGEACDLSAEVGFDCFAPPNDAPVGMLCDASAGPYCAPGATCVGGVCRAFCCTASDCSNGSCQLIETSIAVPVSVCAP